MTDEQGALDAIARAAQDLVPQLTERLVRHSLGEIEVSSGDLRLRVARSGAPPGGAVARAGRPGAAVTDAAIAATAPSSVGVASPAVGFFVYADGLGPGLAVQKGDALGQVEMLGIRHDVRAPRRGTVRHLVAESGEAVEYGQVVLELEA
ncbi:MAG: acetyl-CoA carboxylase biotin carboxyl carrier protein [Chloroflexota bacterium]|nr:acetyl-CoA carboxylase biotin carboxyl carrier protein [Chloroflexota bacterium]